MKCPVFTILVLSLWISSCSQAVRANDDLEVVEVPARVEIKAARETGISHIKKVIRAYNATSAVRMKLKKKVHLELLDQEKMSEGTLLFSKGQLRMKISKPEKTLLVMDGSNIWVENRLPKEMGGKVQVAKMLAPKGAARKRAPLAFLLHTEEVWDEFKITRKMKKNGYYYYELKPIDPDQIPDIVSLKIKIDGKSHAIRKLSFKDDLENLTTFDFTKVKFNAKIKKSEFRYTPPAGAEVTEY